MERRKFLQNTCPTVTFAFFGISFIQACSKSGDDMNSYSENYNSNNNSFSITKHHNTDMFLMLYKLLQYENLYDNKIGSIIWWNIYERRYWIWQS